MSIYQFVCWLLDMLVPRFITERVVFDYSEEDDAYVPVCPVADLQPHEEFPYVCSVRGFNLFGMMVRPVQMTELEPYDYEKETKKK